MAPLPLLVVCEVLGVPAGDRERFYDWIDGLHSVHAHGSDGAASAQREMRAYLADRLGVKRAAPGEDLLTAWVAGEPHDLTRAKDIRRSGSQPCEGLLDCARHLDRNPANLCLGQFVQVCSGMPECGIAHRH